MNQPKYIIQWDLGETLVDESDLQEGLHYVVDELIDAVKKSGYSANNINITVLLESETSTYETPLLQPYGEVMGLKGEKDES